MMKNVNEIIAYGIRLLMPEHEAITTLEKEYLPANYGHQVWDASWLLIDYLNQSGGLCGSNVIDLGCGWGLPGIYCAKAFGAHVTGVDVDDQVQPFLDLIASINHVQVDFLNLAFHQIGGVLLSKTDLIIGSDICFCEGLIQPLYDLINRVESSSVKQVIISDPGRWTFGDLTDYFMPDERVEVITWATDMPYKIEGKIFNIRF